MHAFSTPWRLFGKLSCCRSGIAPGKLVITYAHYDFCYSYLIWVMLGVAGGYYHAPEIHCGHGNTIKKHQAVIRRTKSLQAQVIPKSSADEESQDNSNLPL